MSWVRCFQMAALWHLCGSRTYVDYIWLLAPLPQFSVSDYAHYITQVANLQLGEVLPDGTTVTFIDPPTVAGHVSSQLPSIARPTATIFCLRLCTLHHASGQPSAGWGPPRWHHCHLRWPLCGSKTYKIYMCASFDFSFHCYNFLSQDYAHYITQVASLQLDEVLPDGTTLLTPLW